MAKTKKTEGKPEKIEPKVQPPAFKRPPVATGWNIRQSQKSRFFSRTRRGI